jgi:microfibrillar-associated protein 1
MLFCLIVLFLHVTMSNIEAEELRLKQLRKESEVQKSRNLLAMVMANNGLGDSSLLIHNDCLGEFKECSGALSPPPDDSDDVDGNFGGNDSYALKRREEWDVREILRILREVEEKMFHLTDDAPLSRSQSRPHEIPINEIPHEKSKGKYLQRYFHRGAFYMDEDTLEQAGPDDIRHKAADYARAATGDDLRDKSKLPQVMQVKKFGFAGYSTKYKGLKSEDTTDKEIRYVPITRRTDR